MFSRLIWLGLPRLLHRKIVVLFLFIDVRNVKLFAVDVAIGFLDLLHSFYHALSGVNT